jgi:hypothetical protein
MQMIDLMKRLSELDAGNPNIVKEGVDLEDRSLKTEAKYDPTVDGSHSYGTDLLFNIRMLYRYARDGRDNLVRHQIASLKNLKDGIEQSEEPRLIQCYDYLMKNLAGGTVTDPKMIMQIADKAHQLFHPSLEPIAQATREGVDLEECGPMGMMGTDRSSTPATINMTAASGSELTGMLKDIMQLAGVHQVEPGHLGIEQEPMALTAEPMVSVEPVQGDSDTEVMRSVIDRMHTGDEEETDEGQYDNSPNDPRDVPEFDAEEFAHHENQPGAGFGRRTNQPNANPTAYESLMAEYKEFVAEAESKKKVSEVYGRRSSYYNPMDQERREQGQMDYEKRAFKRAELQHELGHEDDPDFERKQRQQQMDRDRGPWYIKIDGRILRSRGEIKVFDWRKGANNYALAILKNKPELQGKVKLTKSDEDDIMTDNN